MAFTIEDFEDLVRILEQRPEWRAELRRLLLPSHVLDLPQLVRELAAAQARTEEQLGRLAEAQVRTEEQLARLAAAQFRTEEALDRLTAATDWLRGDFSEVRYSRHASGYFGGIMRRIHVLSDEELWDALEEGMAQGQLSHPQARDVALADIVMRGRREDGSEGYLVVEVSWTVDNEDVERALRRAERLGRTGRMVTPVVAGKAFPREVAADARVAGVQCVTDGRPLGPDEDGAAAPGA